MATNQLYLLSSPSITFDCKDAITSVIHCGSPPSSCTTIHLQLSPHPTASSYYSETHTTLRRGILVCKSYGILCFSPFECLELHNRAKIFKFSTRPATDASVSVESPHSTRCKLQLSVSFCLPVPMLRTIICFLSCSSKTFTGYSLRSFGLLEPSVPRQVRFANAGRSEPNRIKCDARLKTMT